MPDLTPDVERELDAVDDALAGRRVPPELTELGELALALRAERAPIDHGFARDLDLRVQRGFSEEDPRRRAPGRRWWRVLWGAPAVATATAVLLVAVIVVARPGGVDERDSGGGGSASSPQSAGSGGSDAGSAESAGAEGSQTARAADSKSARSGSTDSAGGAVAVEPPAPDTPLTVLTTPPAPAPGSPGTDGRARRSVERSASLTLAARSRDIDAVSARIQDVTRQQGGFVVSSTVSSSGDGGGGTFRLRVPTRNLDAAMAALARLGKVRERAQSARDITAQAVSARSSLKDARTERKSLLRQLGDADTLTEAQAIRARLRIVGREIERARAQVRRVDNRAAFATVELTLVADNSAAPAPAEADQWTLGDAARDALRVLEVAAGVVLIVLAVALPLALLAALGALAARWTRRRRREHALDAV
jgi:hypothetical protein